MSRLEEALRRSIGSHSVENTNGEGTNFASPWVLEKDGGAERGQPVPIPSANESAVAAPQPPARLLDVSVDNLGANWKQWLVSHEVEPAVVEQFRKLAASLLHAQRDNRLKVLMVTSSIPSEGKTLTSLNLALVFAESYQRRVLLIDADMRRPRLSEAANLTVSEGLGEVLKSSKERKASLVQLTDHLWLLPAGRPDPQPLSALTSHRMQQLLEEAAERFDWVIVDTPPVTLTADAGLIGALVDGTVLVVRAGRTPHPAVRQAVETLGRERIFGVVLNGVSDPPQEQYYHAETRGTE